VKSLPLKEKGSDLPAQKVREGGGEEGWQNGAPDRRRKKEKKGPSWPNRGGNWEKRFHAPEGDGSPLRKEKGGNPFSAAKSTLKGGSSNIPKK